MYLYVYNLDVCGTAYSVQERIGMHGYLSCHKVDCKSVKPGKHAFLLIANHTSSVLSCKMFQYLLALWHRPPSVIGVMSSFVCITSEWEPLLAKWACCAHARERATTLNCICTIMTTKTQINANLPCPDIFCTFHLFFPRPKIVHCAPA